ncbi:hypothetical protein Pla144_42620 [Bythopirellula polymerisocia]|uniref:Uncharacterized protein n=1 Tax=Bythopirellula polymerisocia TaxID=2528003 RepID=A0A5C6CHQ2_9BACT|nr:hypothetical protein Pla144_42620 [Bythopirellula polymerisocia]
MEISPSRLIQERIFQVTNNTDLFSLHKLIEHEVKEKTE